MPTKFYLLNKQAEPGCFNAGGSWTNNGWQWENGNYTNYGMMIDVVKEGQALKESKVSDDGFFINPPVNHLLFRGFSRKLEPQTISGTFDGIFYTRANGSVIDLYTRIVVSIVDTTGNPFTPVHKAYLVNNYDESIIVGASKWSATFGASAKLFAPITLSSYTIPNDGRDYRILLEFGCKRTSPNGGAPPHSITLVGTRSDFGNTGAPADYTKLPDLVVTSGGPWIGASFFEFSSIITFKPSTYHTNDEPERAIEIGAGPVTVNQIGHLLSVYPQWYKSSIGNTTDRVVSALLHGAGAPGSSTIDLRTFSETNPGIAGPPFAGGEIAVGSNSRSPIMVSLKANCDLFLSTYIGTSAGNTGTLSVVNAPTNPLAGDIMVNVDNSAENIYDPTLAGHGASVWWHPDGQISHVTGILPFSELGVSLDNGNFGIPSQNTNELGYYELLIYSKAPNIALLHRVNLPGFPNSIGTDFKSFYVSIGQDSDFEPPTIYKYSAEGVLSSKSWLLTVPAGDAVKNFGVSRTGSVIYIFNNDIRIIHRHDLVNDVPLPPFTNIPVGGSLFCDVIVMSDNSVVTIYDTDTDPIIYHYASNGTVLHTTPLTAFASYSVDHISHGSNDDPTKIWIWFQGGPAPDNYKFVLIDIITGVVTSQFTTVNFSSGGRGKYSADGNPVRFGVSNSCFFMTMMVPKVPPDLSGIYYMNPTKTLRHDSYNPSGSGGGGGLGSDTEKKIPNPTIKTALLGE